MGHPAVGAEAHPSKNERWGTRLEWATRLPVHRYRIRGHARAHPSSHQRTAGEEPVNGNAGTQTRLCAASFGAGEAERQSAARPSLRRRSATHLAETLLRFQRVDGTETD